MTGEMVDLFANREDGVRRIAAELVRALAAPSAASAQAAAAPAAAGSVHFFAGDAGWCRAEDVPIHWESIASANWLATARHAALHFGTGLLVDINGTTTDLIAFKDARAGPQPHRRAAPGHRRTGLSRCGAYPALRHRAAHRLARRAAQRDERILCQRRRCLSPDGRIGSGA
jgi:hypothetical protein